MSLKSLLSSVALTATLSNPINATEPTTLENKVLKPTKAQLEEAVKNNPYCGKPGYECKAEGWDVPDVRDSKFLVEKRALLEDGKQKFLRGYVTPNGIKFGLNIVDGTTYLVHVKGNPDHGYLDSNCDGIFEVKLSMGTKLEVPKCAYK